MMNPVEKAVRLFQNGLNCSQAILAVFGEPHGLDLESAKDLGRPLGGGMGRLGLMCGAVSGAILALGVIQGHAADEGEARNRMAASVQELVRRFESRRGTTLCKELLGADMNTESGRKKIKDGNLVPTLCPGFVRDAAEILLEISSVRP